MTFSLYVKGDLYNKAHALISLFLPRFTFEKGGADADIVCAERGGFDTPESYTLKIINNKVDIEYQSYLGLRNAFATLSLKVRQNGEKVIIEDTDITDSPACTHRGIMLDNARGVMPLERLFYDITLAAKAKFNILHLHLADSKGAAVELDCLPDEMRLDGYYTKAQVKALVDRADILGLEIIPEFDMPAHSTKILSLFPELECTVGGTDEYKWTICAGTEKTYELYRAVIEEMCGMFAGSRYFHIGGDELEFSDLTPPRYCHWGECEKCKKMIKKHSLADRQQLVYYFFNRINKYVNACGRQTVMWSDQIDCTREKGLDDNILMQFWRIAGEGRGPHDGCSLEGQLKYGYNVINSYYPNTYVDIEKYATPQKIAEWRWDDTPEIPEQYKAQILGGEMCAWEYGNRRTYYHYDYSLPSSTMLFGDKLWRGDKREYTKEDEIALTRAVLGSATPDGLNVFEAAGSIIPPKITGPNKQYAPAYVQNITCGEQKTKDIIAALSDESLYTDGDKMRAGFYKESAEFALMINKKMQS